MNIISLSALFVAALFLPIPGANAQMNTARDVREARQEIWALEQSIYASRGRGDFKPYIDGASDNFMAPFPTGGWSMGKDGLRRTGAGLDGNSNEQIDMNFKAFTLHDDTAVIYYLNHRTKRPEGEVVDEWYEVMHVWARAGEGWALVASMPRRVEGYQPTN